MKLRPLARPFIICTIRNGATASFWFDQWTPLGPLIDTIGVNGPHALRVPLHATVSEATRDGLWLLPAPRSNVVVSLHAYLTTMNVPSHDQGSDLYSWTIEGLKLQHFSSSKTWSVIRERQPARPWFQAVWFKWHTPKHAFNMWVAVQDILPTRTRLASWGMLIPTSCCLCSVSDETRDHLFVDCPYIKILWGLMLRKISGSLISFTSWTQLLGWSSSDSTTSPRTLRSIAVQATIYHTWTERNNRVYRSQTLSASDLFRLVDRTIRNTISARKTRKEFKNLMVLWLI